MDAALDLSGSAVVLVGPGVLVDDGAIGDLGVYGHRPDRRHHHDAADVGRVAGLEHVLRAGNRRSQDLHLLRVRVAGMDQQTSDAAIKLLVDESVITLRCI